MELRVRILEAYFGFHIFVITSISRMISKLENVFKSLNKNRNDEIDTLYRILKLNDGKLNNVIDLHKSEF